jgi:hypothetical protein
VQSLGNSIRTRKKVCVFADEHSINKLKGLHKREAHLFTFMGSTISALGVSLITKTNPRRGCGVVKA